ncbi:hypothetical protein STEG23_030484, partial [Scotinomys teguina]
FLGIFPTQVQSLIRAFGVPKGEVVATQTIFKKEKLSLTDKMRMMESCISEEHKKLHDSMRNLEYLARQSVHYLELAHMQALDETLSKCDKGPNKQEGKTIQIVTSPDGSHTMAYPVIVHGRTADDIYTLQHI